MHLRRGIIVLAILALAIARLPAARAADPEFVGVLALANEDAVAKQLGLSDEVRTKLAGIIDQRENGAVELAMQKDLPADQQAAKLQAYRKESEKLGLDLLTADQRKQLERVRLGRAGLPALVEPDIAKQLQLTDSQRTRIAEILKDRDAALKRATSTQRQSQLGYYEKKLSDVLTDTQRNQWGQLADDTSGAVVAATDAPAKTTETAAKSADVATTPTEKPSDATPAASTGPSTTRTVAAPSNRNTKLTSTKDTSIQRTGDGKIVFNFRNQQWKDALEWFAQAADLSLVMDAVPSGTFNYQDDRAYTLPEAIDIINSILLDREFTLVRRDRMLKVVSLKDGVPPNLVPIVTPDDLEKHGKYELVSMMLPLNRLSTDEALQVVKPLLSLQGLVGSVVPLPQSKQLLVTETAGRMKLIQQILQKADGGITGSKDEIRTFDLRHTLAKDTIGTIKQLMTIPEGTVRMLDIGNNRLLVSGPSEVVSRIADIVK
ncbi:MAG TPA: secretin N-terminal domain-containing protein, partial [Pirellulales bacterium]